MFGESTPISKSFSTGKVADDVQDNIAREYYEKYVPSCSLGMTQMFPKNLGKDLDGCEESSGLKKQKQVQIVDKSINELHINVRPRRALMPVVVCRSPFVTRVIDVNGHKITTQERNVWEWLLQNRRNKKDNIFKWKDRLCTKGHFQSLQDNKMVQTTVIDTWTCLLNENEILRSNTSPLRLFFTSETTYGPLQNNLYEGNKISSFCSFNDHVEHALKMVSALHNRLYDVTDFDMLVFPMFDSAHHYIISYNIKKPSCEIIDNRGQTMGMDETYDNLPDCLHKCFCQFLECYKLPNFEEIKRLKPVVLKMPLQTVDNHIDCGVFSMRHMETYTGNACRWYSGLRTEMENQKSILDKLRIIYSNHIMTWAENEKRAVVSEICP